MLDGATGITTVVIDGKTYALVASLVDDGVQIIDITTPTAPTAVASITDGRNSFNKLDAAIGITTVVIGTKTYALVASLDDDGVQIIDITTPTAPTAVASISDGTTFDKLDGAIGITTVVIGTKTYALVAAQYDNGVQIIDITTPSDPTAVASITDGTTFDKLDGAIGITTVVIGTKTYALVASLGDDGVQIIDITTPSDPTAVASITDGRNSFDELNGARGITTVVIGTKTYALVASEFDNGVQIIDITTPSAPTAVASITDGTTFDKLDGATGITTVVIGTKTYALVTGFSDDGVQIIDITTPTDPTAVASISDGTTFDKLNGAASITTVMIGTKTYALVASFLDDGVQIIQLGNEAPTITSPSTFTVQEGTTDVGTLTATDPDGTTPTFSITGGADQTAFTLTTAGVLTFNTAPDFETKTSYTIEVTADDGNSGTDTQTITITVTDVNEDPIITSSNTFSVVEGTTDVGTLTATDPDRTTPTFSITGGADQTAFTLTTAGVLTFNTASDFETKDSYTIEVTADDGKGGTDTQTITITVTDVNEAPTITSPSTFTVQEGTTDVGTLTATDPEGVTPTLSITGGGDQTAFTLTTAGVLTFNTASDFETKDSYTIEVTASDGTLSSSAQTITITVTDVNEAPIITSPSTFTVQEGTTDVGTLTATDPEGVTPTFSITGGADQTAFTLTTAGVLTFNTASDFETKDSYTIEVTASDGTLSSSAQTITITVTLTLQATASITDGGVDSTGMTFDELNGAYSITTVVIDGKTYALVASFDDDGVQIIDITDPTTPLAIASITDGAMFDELRGASDITTVVIDDKTYALVASLHDDGVQIIDITTPATPLATASITDGAMFDELRGASDITTVVIDDKTYALVAAQYDAGVQIIDITTPNAPLATASITDGDTDTNGNAFGELRGALGITTVVIDTKTYALVAASTDDGVQIIDITDPATPLATALIRDTDDGDEFDKLDGASGITTVVIDGKTYALVTGFDDDGVQIIDITTPAAPLSIASIADGEFNGALGITTVVIGGKTYALVAALDNAGVQIIDITTPTAPTVVASISDGTTFDELNGARGITTVVIDSKTYALVASFFDDGVQIIQLGNEAPTITSSNTFSVVEGTTDVGTLTATDPDGTTPTFSITGGADQTAFTLTTAGVLTFNTAPDFETKASYTIEVTADDGNSVTDTQTITITVTDVNEAPTITSSNTFSVVEGTTDVGRLTATDPEGTTPTFSITGGADQTAFTLTTAGVLTFNTAPDFETKASYTIEVTASDGTLSSSAQTITITVTLTLQATASISDGTTFDKLDGATGITTVVIGTKTYALVVASTDDGVQIIDITTPSDPTAVASITDGGTDTNNGVFGELNGAYSITTVVIGTKTYALVASFDDAGVQIIDITTPSDPTAVASITDGKNSFDELGGARSITTVVIDTKTYALVASVRDDGVQIIDITTPSDPTAVASITDGGNSFDQLDGASGITTVVIGTKTYALVTGFSDDGVQIIDITTPSDPTAVASITDGRNSFDQLDGAAGITTVVIDTKTYALVAAQYDNGVQIIDITTPAIPTAVASITDGTTFDELNGASGITTVVIGTKTYALVASYEDAGVQIIDITTPSDPTAVASITDGTTFDELNGASGITTVVIDGKTYALVASVFDDGVQIIQLGSESGANVNTAPTITSSNTFSVVEGTTDVGTLTATDPDGTTPTFSITGGADQTAFTLTTAGVLTFNTAPDFESPTDADTNNQYIVIVTATDGTLSSSAQTITITITDVNEAAPTITSSNTFSVVEGTTDVGTLTATDPDGTTPTFSITGGADQTAFTLTTAGVLTFNTAPDFESPTDADTNNQYIVIVTATDGTLSSSAQTITITITDVNEAAPTITSSNTFSVVEGITDVGTLTATDPDGTTPTFSITGGADQTAFTLTTAGVLTFNTAPDFESPTDADTNNQYIVMVTATDGTLSSSAQTITITITDVNEAAAPTITSSNTFSVVEGTTDVGTLTATDPDGTTPTFSITGGADQTAFTLTTAGVLTFNTAPDFESPTDADTNNQYIVIVTATDGTLSSSAQTITITITDVNEAAPTITSSNTFSVVEGITDVGTLTATDPDGTTPTFSITGGADQTAFTLTTAGVLTFNTAPDFESPTDADTNNQYIVMVTATDGTLSSSAQTITITITDVNEAAPTITSSNTFSVVEGTTDVGTLTATDPKGTTPTFSITGGADQTAFTLTTAGVLTFNTAPDFESPTDADTNNQYIVMVTATDGTLSSSAQTITITITDVNEAAPTITSSNTFSVVEGITDVGTLTATDPDGTTPTFSITGGADQTAFTLTTAGVLTFNTAPDFESPTDADTNNQYIVIVTATDGTLSSSAQTITITITDVNEAAPTITSSNTFSVVEGITDVGTLTATDPDGTTPTFSITGGVDQTAFTLTTAGVLTFNTAPDFESPTDADTNNQYIVMVTATDGTLSSSAQTITITITDVNEAAPTITSSNTFSVVEGITDVGTLTATDPDGTTPTFSITGGADQTAFTLTTAGVLTFNTAPDFESPTDADTNNQYIVMVTATDGTLSSSAQTITITITDVNEAAAPTITSSNTFSVVEGITDVGTLTATDPDGTTPTFSITGGADQTAFTLTTAGVLTFNTAPDFETKASYTIEVTASDGTLSSSAQTITITITDVNEAAAPTITSSNTFSVVEGITDVGTLTATDPDGTTPTFSITGGADQTAFTLTTAGVLTFNTAPDFETKASYTIEVTASDGTLSSSAQTITITITDVNEAPVITGGNTDTVTFSVAENATVGTGVGTVTATDPDNDILTFSIIGGDTENAFAIDITTGVITVAGTLNSETRSSYSLTVAVVDDGASALSNTAIITVNVIAAPVISISTNMLTTRVNVDITPITITSTGGQVDSYRISPDLAEGLSFDVSTGTISGRPTTIAGEVLYTIAATNIAGTTSVTVAITVDATAGNEDFNKIGVSVWPNPTNDIINIHNIVEDKATYSLFNITGKVLKKGVLTKGYNSVNISLLAKGVYFLNIKTSKGSLIEKVVRN